LFKSVVDDLPEDLPSHAVSGDLVGHKQACQQNSIGVQAADLGLEDDSIHEHSVSIPDSSNKNVLSLAASIEGVSITTGLSLSTERICNMEDSQNLELHADGGPLQDSLFSDAEASPAGNATGSIATTGNAKKYDLAAALSIRTPHIILTEPDDSQNSTPEPYSLSRVPLLSRLVS
jgi:hypothetical protein